MWGTDRLLDFGMPPVRSMQGTDVDFQQKLILRLQHLCQLEALLKAVLCHAPASLSLPTTAGTIMPFAELCLVCPLLLYIT